MVFGLKGFIGRLQGIESFKVQGSADKWFNPDPVVQNQLLLISSSTTGPPKVQTF